MKTISSTCKQYWNILIHKTWNDNLVEIYYDNCTKRKEWMKILLAKKNAIVAEEKRSPFLTEFTNDIYFFSDTLYWPLYWIVIFFNKWKEVIFFYYNHTSLKPKWIQEKTTMFWTNSIEILWKKITIENKLLTIECTYWNEIIHKQRIHEKDFFIARPAWRWEQEYIIEYI